MKDGNYVVGGAETRCDCVFYITDINPLGFIECRSNLANTIPADMTLDEMRGQSRKKVDYFVKVHSYLTERYQEPVIFFACYNLNYEIMKNNVVNNWGYAFLQFLGPEEMVAAIESRGL